MGRGGGGGGTRVYGKGGGREGETFGRDSSGRRGGARELQRKSVRKKSTGDGCTVRLHLRKEKRNIQERWACITIGKNILGGGALGASRLNKLGHGWGRSWKRVGRLIVKKKSKGRYGRGRSMKREKGRLVSKTRGTEGKIGRGRSNGTINKGGAFAAQPLACQGRQHLIGREKKAERL